MKIFQTNNFLLLSIFCIPLYLIKVTFWILPTNLFELLVIFASIFTLYSKRKVIFLKINTIPKIISVSVLLILIGLITSVIHGGSWKIGFGIIKGWFLIPLLLSFAIYLTADSHYVKKIYSTLFYSAALVSAISLVYKILGLVTYDNRLSAFYLSPNHLAMYLAPGFILGTYFIMSSKKLYWPHLILTLCIGLSLYFTYSYGAWIGLMVSLFILTYNKNEAGFKIKFITLGIILTIFFLQLSSNKLSDLWQNPSHSSLSSRFIIWSVSAEIIKESPFTGIGPGNFQNEYLSRQKYYPPYQEWAVPQPHNIILAFWLQSGFIGLVGFILLSFYIFKISLNLHYNKKGISMPLVAFFIYTFTHGIVDTTYWKNDLSVLFWIFVSLTIIIFACLHEKKDRS